MKKFNIPKFKSMNIEINSDCNRRCVFCPRGQDKTRWKTDKNGKKKLIGNYMSDELVYSLIDQNLEQEFNAKIGFIFYNEPTLDERLFDFIDYASQKCPGIDITTNGDKIKKDSNYAREFFKFPITAHISLYDYKDMEGRQKLIDWWNDYLIKDLNITKDKFRFTGNYFNFGNRAGLIDRRGKYLAHAKLDDLVPLKASCRKIHSKLNIRYDGEVPICCEDSLVQHSLGNVNNNTISEIWYGEKMKIATELLANKKRHAISPCNKCTKGAKDLEV